MKTSSPPLHPDLSLRFSQDIDTFISQAQRLAASADIHTGKLRGHQTCRIEDSSKGWNLLQSYLAEAPGPLDIWGDAQSYTVDAIQRWFLTLNVLSERSTNDRRHEEAGTPPVLNYDYSVVLDGSTFDRPVNYKLLCITPPPGCQIDQQKQPFMIIDPRAGHGAGIGGFKPDSQVGVALRGGHPVYFVVFTQHPIPGQTLADVMHAEAQFVREVANLHPAAAQPVVIGNCQGGWATLLLAATYPELTGPLVINGAPVATWSGKIGDNPMRYKGGLRGGVVPALLAADLGNGAFDGAHLVSNFESLNPGRNYFGKYYDLYSKVDSSADSFLEFERWWGGYHFTNEAEIRWIVEQLFVGNRLARGQAQLEPGLNIDLRNIQSPIVVFASRGDNITPPQQALNWVADTFTDEHEIRIRGQRIIYMVHDHVGHLGIFVSSSIARKEHAEVSSTLKTIEALAPGLYEMRIDDVITEGHDPHFVVSFEERTMSDLLGVVPNDREQENDFAAVAQLSEFGAQAYGLFLRPFVQSLVTPQVAEGLRRLHPARVSRQIFSADNPWMSWNKVAAGLSKAERQPAKDSNVFLQLEKHLAQSTIRTLDVMRDLNEAQDEIVFLSLYGSPYMRLLGAAHANSRALQSSKKLRHLPEVEHILSSLDKGGLAEAVIRMLILLAGSRGSVRRDRLERSNQVLTNTEPFKSMGLERRSATIREQSIVVEFEAKKALATLTSLLNDDVDKYAAINLVQFVVGDQNDMEPHSKALLQKMQLMLRSPN